MYVLVQPDSQRRKSGPVAAKCVFTGYTGSGYRCWDPKALCFWDSRHVVCIERARNHAQLPPVPPPSEDDIRCAFAMASPPPARSDASGVAAYSRLVDIPTDDPGMPDTPVPGDPDPGEVNAVDVPLPLDEEDLHALGEDPGALAEGRALDAPGSETDQVVPLRIGTRTRKLNPRYARVTVLAALQNRPAVPSSFKEAMAGPDAGLWAAALAKEIGTLVRMGTFVYVATLPPGCKALKGLLVFAVKIDGTCKVCLVIKGCAQRFGRDYFATFSPVARSASMQLVVAVTVRDGLILYAANLNAACLNGRLEEQIHMEQPEGWTAPPGQEKSYLSLVHSLYGLKQAGRIWYECLSLALLDMGFSRFDSDNCVFMRRRKDTGLILIAVHVDDLTGAAPNDAVWDSFCEELNAKYELKNLGRTWDILGLEISQDLQAGTASITQTQYIEDLARQYGVYDMPQLSLPLPPGQRFSKA